MAIQGGTRDLDQGAAASLWRHTLSQIPSLFGRLVYLASLRNQHSGRYEHFGLAQRFGAASADQAIRASHEESFQDWLSLGLEQQRVEVGEYLLNLETQPSQAVETWLRISPQRNYIPSGAGKVEQDLYLQDFEAILYLLRNEYGVPSPDPDA
jgi:hypothetical protein